MVFICLFLFLHHFSTLNTQPKQVDKLKFADIIIHMNNSERFYYETGICIDILEQLLKKDIRKIDVFAKKFLTQTEKMGLDIFNLHFSLLSLLDITSLALNKEKIEDATNINWDNYHGKRTANCEYIYTKKFSQIPHFKEWVQVLECKQSYKAENAQAWMKILRNAFLHGQFELDYTSARYNFGEIKIFQGTNTKTTLKAKVLSEGLNEFVEDNFRNTFEYHSGIMDNYIMFGYPENMQIKNRKELEDFLSRIVNLTVKINHDSFTYNGNYLVKTGEENPVPFRPVKKSLQIDENNVQLPEFMVDSSEGATRFSPEAASMLATIVEKRTPEIYTSKKPKTIIHKILANYTNIFYGVNMALQNLTHILSYIFFNAALNIKEKFNYDFAYHTLDYFTDTLPATFATLKLYRLMYRLENRNFPPIDYANLHCHEVFGATPEQLIEIEKKANKILNNGQAASQDEALNKAYITIMRDALAHGHVEFIKDLDENGNILNFIRLEDIYEKNGVKSHYTLLTTPDHLNILFNVLDSDLNFADTSGANI